MGLTRVPPQSLIQTANFQHILRISNNNVNGKDKIAFAITGVPGIGRRFATLMCKKADIDLNKRCVWRWCGGGGARRSARRRRARGCRCSLPRTRGAATRARARVCARVQCVVPARAARGGA